MNDIIWHFLVGMVVSFIGSIPLGSINLSTLQIALEKNVRAALLFALGATLVELVYSYIAIKFSAFLLSHKDVELYIQLVAIPAFVILSIQSFRKKASGAESKEVNNRGKSSFLKGIFIGLVNPLQIPFWVAYGTYMLSNKWITNDGMLLNVFIIGIVTGTYLLLSLVIFGSKAIDAKLNLSRFNMNKAIGAIFLALAVYQTVKLVI